MMRFDALGLGDSDGDWGDGSFTVKANDVIAACTFMAERGTPADILIGHSFGGAAVLAARGTPPAVRVGKDCPAAARICKQLAKDGIAMMRFDALGLGDSVRIRLDIRGLTRPEDVLCFLGRNRVFQ